MAREKGLPPIYTAESKVLILGTFPSAKSRKEGIYYAESWQEYWKWKEKNKLQDDSEIDFFENVATNFNGNKFWKVIYHYIGLTQWKNELIVPEWDKQKAVLDKCKIAVWDLFKECDIDGSKDSTIKNPDPNDLQGLLQKTKIEWILFNGKTAFEMYQNEEKFKNLPVQYKILPSTSRQNLRHFSFAPWIDALKSILNK